LRLYKYSGCATAAELLGRAAGRQCLAILLFHRVTDAVPEDGLTVGTARFGRICRLLRRRFRVVPLAEVFRIVRLDLPMPPRTVAVTFDDCYRDNLEAAASWPTTACPPAFSCHRLRRHGPGVCLGSGPAAPAQPDVGRPADPGPARL